MPDFWYEICRTEMFNPTWTGVVSVGSVWGASRPAVSNILM